MNGGHDLGGMHGLGPIGPEPESEEPVFHAEWERRIFALSVSSWSFRRWSGDADRHAIERQHPVDYLRNSYYHNWLVGLETLLIESKLVSAGELASGRADGPAQTPDNPPSDEVSNPELRAPLFKLGNFVRARTTNPSGHTRMPRYVRGVAGVVVFDHGAHVFADKSAHGVTEWQRVYCVRFEARALWGENASANDVVHVDLWEQHLEPA